jgi:hypothetical protein
MSNPISQFKSAFVLLPFTMLLGCGDNGTVEAPAASSEDSAVVAESTANAKSASGYPTQAFFGETHLHTALSMDAGMTGTTLLPADGYRFAKGEEVISSTGVPAKLARPLDFVVVADHSDNLGIRGQFT